MAEHDRSCETFQALALPHLDGLYRLALRLTGDPSIAEDLVQETFLKGLRGFGSLRDASRTKPWLFRILSRLVKGLRNIEFKVTDASDLDEKAEPASFDFITTFDAVHDQARPLSVLKGIHRSLKPGGWYLMQDIKGSSDVRNNIGHPLGTFLYTASCMHCMTVSLAQGGEGLGTMWGEEKTREYVERAGFRSIEKRELAHDIQNNWYVIRK